MPGKYYKTCPDCGANLDPEEKCDCDKINTMQSNKMTITFDMSSSMDISVASVFGISKNNHMEFDLLKTFYGEEATDLYLKLGGKMS